MATATIKVVTSDNILEFSGSMALVRKIDAPATSSDFRIAVAVMVSSSYANSSEQVFNPAVSIYETYQFGLTSGTDVLPGATSGSYISSGQAVGGTAKVYGYDNGKKSLYSLKMLAKISPNTSSKADNLTQDVPLRAGESSASVHMFRLVKNSTNEIIATMRDTTLSFVNLPITDSTFNNYLTNIANTNEYIKSTYTFATEADRDAAFAALNTFVITWPYTAIPLRIVTMGYRII